MVSRETRSRTLARRLLFPLAGLALVMGSLPSAWAVDPRALEEKAMMALEANRPDNAEEERSRGDPHEEGERGNPHAEGEKGNPHGDSDGSESGWLEDLRENIFARFRGVWAKVNAVMKSEAGTSAKCEGTSRSNASATEAWAECLQHGGASAAAGLVLAEWDSACDGEAVMTHHYEDVRATGKAWASGNCHASAHAWAGPVYVEEPTLPPLPV